MPPNKPFYGEFWISQGTEGRKLVGVITSTTSTSATVTSFSGIRHAIALNRFGLRTEPGYWSFFSPSIPKSDFACFHHGCDRIAPLAYTRKGRIVHSCPLHLPMGTACTLASLSKEPENHKSIAIGCCPNCSSPDPVEDLSLSLPNEGAFLWVCLACGTRWLALSEAADLGHMQEALGALERHVLAVKEIDFSYAAWESWLEKDCFFGPAITVFGHPYRMAGTVPDNQIRILLQQNSCSPCAVNWSTTLPNTEAILNALLRREEALIPGSLWESTNSLCEIVSYRPGFPSRVHFVSVLDPKGSMPSNLSAPEFLSTRVPLQSHLTGSLIVAESVYKTDWGEQVRVKSVDVDRQVVEVMSMHNFTTTFVLLRDAVRWEKVHLKTLYDHLNDDEL